MAANPPGLRVLVVLVLSRWCFVMHRSEEGLREARQPHRSPSRASQAFRKAASHLVSIYIAKHASCVVFRIIFRRGVGVELDTSRAMGCATSASVTNG
jgi:hypothetical protein